MPSFTLPFTTNSALYTLKWKNYLHRILSLAHLVINKVGVQFSHILLRKLHTQACEIVGGTKRKLCKKFQVDICKTKKDRSAHAQLCNL